jgi:hypothetical protein
MLKANSVDPTLKDGLGGDLVRQVRRFETEVRQDSSRRSISEGIAGFGCRSGAPFDAQYLPVSRPRSTSFIRTLETV